MMWWLILCEYPHSPLNFFLELFIAKRSGVCASSSTDFLCLNRFQSVSLEGTFLMMDY